ncbi:MAG TPA: LytTR family DNA-binding domain-containing protein [Candidatus Limosilactobacillus faecipullorum]|nr:LytTR family DNA-binding domain-containing protein [Candidatus Limosilactobacillus faecipullorum]
MTLPVFICEDESILLKHYTSVIKNWIMINNYDMNLVLSASNAQDIIHYLDTHLTTNSLYFLDIDLKSSFNGIEIAQKIRQQNKFAQIVFITSHQELAIETLKRQISPLNYIVKDNKTEDAQIKGILDSLNRTTAIDQTPQPSRHLKLTIGARTILVDLTSIYFLETSTTPHKIILYGKQIMYEFYGKIGQLAADYPELIRIHKSFLINPKKIKAVDFKQRLIYFPEDYSCTFPLAKYHQVKKLITASN